MVKCLKKLIMEEKGAIMSTEYLIITIGALGLAYVVYTTVQSSLGEIHSSTVKSITSLSRGY